MPIKWTKEQKEILEHELDKDARILAGPGTGKSATVVEWVGRLLKKTPELKVRLLTFTRAATAELVKKLGTHPAGKRLKPSTIHSFAISILLQNSNVGNFPRPLRIVDDWEMENIIHPDFKSLFGFPVKKTRTLFVDLASNWESLKAGPPGRDVSDRDRERFMAAWKKHRTVFGYTLLAELPWALLNALSDRRDLRGTDYDLLAVDEYQDLNACDLDVLKRFSALGCRIVGIGDDDQSIYSFRRAAPEGIRRFLSDYPGANDYPLSTTHRCGANIIEWAKHVVERDETRLRNKPPLTPASGSSPGETALLEFAGNRLESDGVARIVERLIDEEGIKPNQILILLKNDFQERFSAPIKKDLEERDIAYSDYNEVKEILKENDNQKFLACLRLLSNERDSLAWRAIMKLTDGIGEGFVKAIYKKSLASRKQFGEVFLEEFQKGFPAAPARTRTLAAKLAKSVVRWVEDVDLPPVIPEGGWGLWINGLDEFPIRERPSDELRKMLCSVDDIFKQGGLDQFLGQFSPLARDLAQATGEGVRIMTMAASKGLTVDAVIIPSAEESIVPSYRPDADVDEEARVLYVAMTRARRFLFCTWAARRTGPTARTSQSVLVADRKYSSFLADGPVESQDGDDYIEKRWP